MSAASWLSDILMWRRLTHTELLMEVEIGEAMCCSRLAGLVSTLDEGVCSAEHSSNVYVKNEYFPETYAPRVYRLCWLIYSRFSFVPMLFSLKVKDDIFHHNEGVVMDRGSCCVVH